jgi:CDP-diacylglycerol--glycerol-3-phosphate 3-phosphatidyltransferase
MLAYVLTLGRLPIAAAFVVAAAVFVNDGHISTNHAIVLLALAIAEELTDIFDGWAARRFGTVSKLGGILDPLVDSLSRAAIYFALAHAGWITPIVPLVMVARDIVVAYTRIANASVGAKVSARLSGKLKAVIQGGGIPLLIVLAMPATSDALAGGTIELLRVGAACIIITATVWSLFDYVVGAWPAIRQMKNT